jgi:serine/threonine protein kinase
MTTAKDTISPGLPTILIERYLIQEGFTVEEVLAFGGLCTVVRVQNTRYPDLPDELAIKVFYGYHTAIDAAPLESRSRYYGYKFYVETSKSSLSYWKQKFVREATTLAALDSDLLTPILFERLDRPFPYYGMRLLCDGSLSDYVGRLPSRRIDRPGIAVDEALRIARILCQGVHLLHTAGIVHRDLTPMNIMMDGDRPRIGDLGYARYLDSPAGSEDNKSPFFYWPPEHDFSFSGSDARADVYSLGVIMYWLLTGTLPRFGSPAPHSVDNCIPVDLSRAVIRCIDYNREERYQSAHALLEALNSVQM